MADSESASSSSEAAAAAVPADVRSDDGDEEAKEEQGDPAAQAACFACTRGFHVKHTRTGLCKLANPVIQVVDEPAARPSSARMALLSDSSFKMVH